MLTVLIALIVVAVILRKRKDTHDI